MIKTMKAKTRAADASMHHAVVAARYDTASIR
jgi:hypothetical protein